MAVKARDQVTVAVAVDVASVDVYYKLQPSTSTAPSKPTTANPDGWTTIEPTYDEESTNTLYTCQKTTLTDGTFYWSAVSKSTAYEASKTAWNLAHNTSQELANLSMGGVNLIVFNTATLGRLDGEGKIYASSDGAYHVHTEPISVEGSTPYVLSWFYKVTEYTNCFLYVSWLDIDGGHISRTNVEKITNIEPSYRKFISPENAAYAVVNIPNYLANKCMAKFEKGSIPSDMSLSVYDATNQPNILRGTNQPDVLRDFGGDLTLWDDGLWRVQSGNDDNGNAEIFEVNDCEDTRQHYGFRVWSTTTGNKDVGQGRVPYKAGAYYRVGGFVRLTDTSPEQQTSATLQFRVYGSSAMKSYILEVASNEWTQFSYAFVLNTEQAAISHVTLFGVKGNGSLDFCGLYIHEGYVAYRMSLGEKYLQWQPAIEDYASYGLVTSHLSKIDTDFQVLEESIESKVDATDVYTKNTIDGMFSTEVTNRNTAISQTQSAIEQRVSETYSTKTDTSQMAQPNLSPYFSHPTNDIFNSTTNPDGYWLSVLDTNHWSALTDGWSHAECTAGSSVIYCNCFVRKKPEALKTSTQYTFLIEWRNVEMTTASVNFTITSNNSTYVDPFTDASKLIAISTAEGSSYVFVTTSDDLSSSNILSRGYLTVAANSTVSGDFRISLYEGDYSGPYKPYIDQSLASRVSHAEATLSVHATEIDARVEKDGVIAAINASVEESGGSAVKIQADKVAIDGTAIFTAIKSQTDNAYDAKGAAADVQDNLDNLSIGGRNLLKGTSSIPISTRVFSRDISCSDAYGWYAYSTKMTITATENGVKFTHNATTNRDGIVLYLTEENACVGGEDLVLSCEYRTNVSGWYTPYILNTEAPNTQDDNSMKAVVSTEEWQKGVWKLNFPSTEDNTTLAFLFGYIGIANGWIEIKKNTLKLEKGNTATAWSPAPEDTLYHSDMSNVVVSVYPVSIDWNTEVATLGVRCLRNGQLVTPTGYSWTRDSLTTVLGTTATLEVTDLDAVYNCTVTFNV